MFFKLNAVESVTASSSNGSLSIASLQISQGSNGWQPEETIGNQNVTIKFKKEETTGGLKVEAKDLGSFTLDFSNNPNGPWKAYEEDGLEKVIIW